MFLTRATYSDIHALTSKDFATTITTENDDMDDIQKRKKVPEFA
jgi:hypothetical protein